MHNKTKYIEFCKTEENIPIFSQYWWLDAVCGTDNWDVVIIEKGGKIAATMPYYFVNKKGVKHISMPLLTQTLGPYIAYPSNQKYENRLSFEKEVLTEIINQLPDFGYFRQHFHYSITNWLPFYWKGFKQSTRYTYVIDNLNDLESVYKNFNHSKKKNIKKALKQNLEIKYDLPAKDFYENHKLTLKKQNETIAYSFELFKNIYNEAYTRNAGRVIYALDSSSNIHSALFVIWDKNSAYDLISTIDPDFRNSGSASLLVKEIISYVAAKTNKFDFEGSMIENVENSFRKFGAKQIPYFSISKTNSKKLRLRNSLAEIKNILLNK